MHLIAVIDYACVQTQLNTIHRSGTPSVVIVFIESSYSV